MPWKNCTTMEQKIILFMSEDDIKNNRPISQEEFDTDEIKCPKKVPTPKPLEIKEEVFLNI